MSEAHTIPAALRNRLDYRTLGIVREWRTGIMTQSFSFPVARALCRSVLTGSLLLLLAGLVSSPALADGMPGPDAATTAPPEQAIPAPPAT